MLYYFISLAILFLRTNHIILYFNSSIWTRGRKREQGLGDVDDDEVTSNLLREKMEQDLPKELNVTQELFQKFVLAFRRVPDGPE